MVVASKARLRVGGYGRVSTEEQAKGGTSLAGQAEKIRQLCEYRDLDLVEMFEDPGWSAKTLERPGIHAALESLRAGRIEGLVIFKLDRLTRSIVDLQHLLQTYFAEPAPHRLFSSGENIDTSSATGRMFLNVVMIMAQWELEQIQERVQGGHDRVRINGTHPGTVPFGRRAVPTDLKRGRPLEDDPAELLILARILAERDAGRTLRAIAEGLTADGVPTKQAARPRWSAEVISAILATGTGPEPDPAGSTVRARIAAGIVEGLPLSAIARALVKDKVPVIAHAPAKWSHATIQAILKRHKINAAIQTP